ncbi:hypothetical protein, partial [Curtobacterium sp. B18]|uniref:hypothetical protein n=1 Tax=Curtobacterium sp. B18 TaxID=95614 RepID=UPI0005B25C7D
MHETAIDEIPGFRLDADVPRFSVRSATATAVSVVVDGRGTFPLTRSTTSGPVPVPGSDPVTRT